MSILPFLDIGMQILDKVIPDPDARAKARFELEKLQQDGQFKLIDAATQISVAQAATNTAEAAGDSAYAKGWRPSLGYVCVLALGYNYLIYPMLLWFAAYYKPEFKPPIIVEDGLMELVLGMLGLAGLRTFEKLKK